MPVVQFHTVVGQEQIRQQIQERLDKASREVLITWDINEMSKRRCMGKIYLEENFLSDSRMRLHLRHKH